MPTSNTPPPSPEQEAIAQLEEICESLKAHCIALDKLAKEGKVPPYFIPVLGTYRADLLNHAHTLIP